jgi:hypothetical protein
MYNLPPLPASLKPSFALYQAQVPAASPPPESEMVFNTVDDLYEAAGLTEEEEWDVRSHLARGRAKLAGR